MSVETAIHNKRLWLIALLISLTCIVLVASKWNQVQREHGSLEDRVNDKADLQRVLSAGDTVEFKNGRQPILIPTGYFIQSLAFNSASDVNVTGYIWQKYPTDFPAEITKSFIFPEEVNSSSTTLREVYSGRGVQDGIEYELLGWYFDVTLRQSFDYSKYPLDFLTVWLRLWPKEMKNDYRVLFVPDFDAYADTSQHRFGLDQEIVQGEWDIDETFFSYNSIPYDTDFGFFTQVEELSYKEFLINIGMKRKFINAFVINLVPLLIVALLLFAQLMTVTARGPLVSRFDFTASSAIATCSALFFVVLLAHIQVRQQFASSELVYIENFYLVMYTAILFTALNAYLFALDQDAKSNLITWRDNLLPKLAFWPVLLGTITLITWLKL